MSFSRFFHSFSSILYIIIIFSPFFLLLLSFHVFMHFTSLDSLHSWPQEKSFQETHGAFTLFVRSLYVYCLVCSSSTDPIPLFMRHFLTWFSWELIYTGSPIIMIILSYANTENKEMGYLSSKMKTRNKWIKGIESKAKQVNGTWGDISSLR